MSREIVEKALGEAMTARIWTGTYLPVFGCTPQDFSVGALLPAILYMFRWGHRRGKGKFLETYSDRELKKATVRSVSLKLSGTKQFEGFDGVVGKSILGDMLLSSALENSRHAEKHDSTLIRCFASHYTASWIDLPEKVVNLRGVPELIVSLIANQTESEFVKPFEMDSWFPLGCGISDNIFLKALAKGITVQGDFKTSRTSDFFDEQVDLGLDQLLMLRLAQECGGAPSKASGRDNPSVIPNQRPIATAAANQFRKDITTFFISYSGTIPRQSFLGLLESCFAIGLTSVMFSVVKIVEHWEIKRTIPEMSNQSALEFFVDCSVSEDKYLKQVSEQSNDQIRRRLARVPTLLMQMRLLQEYVKQESSIHRSDLPPLAPDGREWLNLLGDIAGGTHEEARDAERTFRRHCRNLADKLTQEEGAEAQVELLCDESGGKSSCVRLSEVLSNMAGAREFQSKTVKFVNSCLMADQPNGLSRSRRVKLQRYTSEGRATGYVYSFILSDSALEYLVHRYLRCDGKDHKPGILSFPRFLEILRERYGFCVDRSPPDMDIPSDLLQRNRRILERRLRDLGLLVGVNDAERMKRLRQRYPSKYDPQSSDDEAAQA